MAFAEPQARTSSGKPGFTEKHISVLSTVESSSQEAVSTESRSRGYMATIKNDDERLLARIGYRQVSYELLCTFTQYLLPDLNVFGVKGNHLSRN